MKQHKEADSSATDSRRMVGGDRTAERSVFERFLIILRVLIDFMAQCCLKSRQRKGNAGVCRDGSHESLRQAVVDDRFGAAAQGWLRLFLIWPTLARHLAAEAKVAASPWALRWEGEEGA